MVFKWSYMYAASYPLPGSPNLLFCSAGPLRPPPNHQAITKSEGGKGVWVKPVPELIVGEIKAAAETNNVDSIPLPGYWIDEPVSYNGKVPVSGEKVLYCLHGGRSFFLISDKSDLFSSAGGYVSFSAHPGDYTSNIPRGMLQHCPAITSAFSIEYRLTKGAPLDINGAFPSALIDALAGYAYLVNDVGFDPKDIILEGDSAGGNLALALTRYLVQYAGQSNLPAPPGNLILLSPLGDMGASHRNSESFHRCIELDYITSCPERWQYLSSAFTGNLDSNSTERDPYFSPGSKNLEMEDVSFVGFPNTLITACKNELLRDSIVYLKNKMTRDMGDARVAYIETPSAVHDVVILEFFEPERTNTLHEISKWVATL
jgi:acetyl esterase/lipase